MTTSAGTKDTAAVKRVHGLRTNALGLRRYSPSRSH